MKPRRVYRTTLAERVDLFLAIAAAYQDSAMPRRLGL